MSTPVPESEYACIFHPRIRSLKQFNVRNTKDNNWYKYGLCPICSNRLAKQESFKKDISDRLEEVLEIVKKKQEEKNVIK